VTEPITYTGAPFTTEPGAIVFLPPDAERGFTEDEAYAFLSGGMDAVEALIAAAGQAHTGAMIAFIPSREDLTELVIDDEAAEPLEELHITAAYLGPAEDVDVETREEIITQLTDLAMNQPVIVADIIGFAVLNPDGPEPCLVANVSGPDVADAHDSILELLDDMGVTLPFQHKPWLAHLTLGYADDPRRWLTDELMEKTGLVTIDRIRVAFAGVVTDIPFGTPPLTAAQAFHMPGQHDQAKHGGLRSLATSEEARVAAKLNKGKKLDPENPTEARMIGGIRGWTGDDASSAETVQSSSRHFKDRVAYSEMYDPTSDDTAGTFARTVAGAPPNAPELHRGMHGVHAGDVPQAGDTFDLGATSFTSSSRVAKSFAGRSTPLSSGDHDVVVRLKKGSRSVQIEQHAGSFKREREHVSMGRFRVTGRRDSVDAKTGRTTVELDIEQIDMDIDVTFKASEQPSVGDYSAFN
jgi:2'-5' RNA ligase